MYNLILKKELSENIKLHELFSNDLDSQTILVESAKNASLTIKNGGKLIFAGNGGSFADAQHLAAEFIGSMGVYRKSLAAIALGTNSSSTTAVSNDYGFNEIFLREFQAIGKKEDFLILISTSGKSENLIKLALSSKTLGSRALILTGKDGGQLKDIFPTIMIPHHRTERIQEMHIFIGHIFCELIEKFLGIR